MPTLNSDNVKEVFHKKPYVHLTKGRDEFFGFECWTARDFNGKYIASALTKKECEVRCRKLGYIPKR